MSFDPASFLDLSIQIGFALVILSTGLTFVRLARGPSLPDRVVALDMMTILIVAFCGLEALSTGVLAFLDVALVLAIIGFLATVALARFAERRLVRFEAERESREQSAGGAAQSEEPQ